MSDEYYKEYVEIFEITNDLCRRFGTSYLDPNRDAIIKAGVQRILDREKWLEDELAKAKEGK